MSEGRLTDEGLIGLVVEHDRLGREAEDLGRLIAAHKQMIGAAEGGGAPRRASSLAEYDRLTTERGAAARLARSEIGGVRAREANLRRRQREIIGDLAARGMPPEVWFRHGDEAVLLERGEEPGIAEERPTEDRAREVEDFPRRLEEFRLRRVLWEAVEKTPEGASVAEVEALSRRIEAQRNRSPTARAAPVVKLGGPAAASLAGILAFHWYLEPTWLGTAMITLVMGGVVFLVLFGIASLLWDRLVEGERDEAGDPASPHRGV